MKTLNFKFDGNAIIHNTLQDRNYTSVEFMNMFEIGDLKCGANTSLYPFPSNSDLEGMFDIKKNPLKLFYTVSPVSMSIFFGNEISIFKLHEEGKRKTFFKKDEIERVIKHVNDSNGLIRCSLCKKDGKKFFSEYVPEENSKSYGSLAFEVNDDHKKKLVKLVNAMKDMTVDGVMMKMKAYKKYIEEFMRTREFSRQFDYKKTSMIKNAIDFFPLRTCCKNNGEIIIDYEGKRYNAEMYFKEDSGKVICRTNLYDNEEKFEDKKGVHMTVKEENEIVLKLIDEVFDMYSL